MSILGEPHLDIRSPGRPYIDVVAEPPPHIRYRAAVLRSRPLGYWPLDEPPGSTVAADVMAGQTLTRLGTAPDNYIFGVPGPFPNATALRCAPTVNTNFFTGDLAEPFDPRAAGFTVEYLGRPAPGRTSSAVVPVTVGQVQAANSQQVSVISRAPINPSPIQPAAWGTGAGINQPIGNMPVVETIWGHWALTFESGASQLSFYGNGAVAGSGTIASGSLGTWLAQTITLGIQRSTPILGSLPQAFFGDLAQLAIYNRALPPQEVAVHAAAGR